MKRKSRGAGRRSDHSGTRLGTRANLGRWLVSMRYTLTAYAPYLEMLACGDKGDMPIRDGVSIRHRASAQIAIPCARRGGVGRRRGQRSVVMYVASSRIGIVCMHTVVCTCQVSVSPCLRSLGVWVRIGPGWLCVVEGIRGWFIRSHATRSRRLAPSAPLSILATFLCALE